MFLENSCYSPCHHATISTSKESNLRNVPFHHANLNSKLQPAVSLWTKQSEVCTSLQAYIPSFALVDQSGTQAETLCKIRPLSLCCFVAGIHFILFYMNWSVSYADGRETEMESGNGQNIHFLMSRSNVWKYKRQELMMWLSNWWQGLEYLSYPLLSPIATSAELELEVQAMLGSHHFHTWCR